LREGGAFSSIREKLVSGRQSLFGAFGIMMVAVTLGGALNYLFSIIMTRMLGETGAFSSFNSLNSIFLIMTMGALAFQTVVTKNVAEFEVRDEMMKVRALAHYFSRLLIISGIAVMAVSVACAWPLAHVLKLDSPVYVIIVGSSIAATLYITLPYGLLQGEQKWIGLGSASIASSLLRIISGFALVAIGFGVSGALGAATIAQVCLIAIVVYYYRELFSGRAESIEGWHPAEALRALLPVAVAVFLVLLMTQIDVVLVKALKGAAEADRYSYGALAGKAVLFFPSGITMVMFPIVSALRTEGRRTGRILAWSLVACLAMEAAVVGFYAIFPGFTSSFFAGKHGKEITGLTGVLGLPFVVLFGLVMAVYALLTILVYYQLALDLRAFIGLLVLGAAAEIALIFAFHRTLPQVLLVMLVVGVALLAVNLVLALVASDSRGHH
jgi:O-antigen/teichoic acid export membrane protein